MEKVLELTKHITQIGFKIDKQVMKESYDLTDLMKDFNAADQYYKIPY
jgi:hypothetical protein